MATNSIAYLPATRQYLHGWQKIGITFNNPSQKDYFSIATLPEGWKIKACTEKFWETQRCITSIYWNWKPNADLQPWQYKHFCIHDQLDRTRAYVYYEVAPVKMARVRVITEKHLQFQNTTQEATKELISLEQTFETAQSRYDKTDFTPYPQQKSELSEQLQIISERDQSKENLKAHLLKYCTTKYSKKYPYAVIFFKDYRTYQGYNVKPFEKTCQGFFPNQKFATAAVKFLCKENYWDSCDLIYYKIVKDDHNIQEVNNLPIVNWINDEDFLNRDFKRVFTRSDMINLANITAHKFKNDENDW